MPRRERAHRRRSAAQVFDDGAAGGVGERREGAVERRRLVSHAANYYIRLGTHARCENRDVSILRSYGILAAGLALLAVGVAVLAANPFLTGASFGWFAYAPLSSETFAPWLGAGILGPLALAALGIALIAGWVGFRLGRRRS